MSTQKQLKIIHAIKRDLGVTPSEYLDLLEPFGVASSKDLSEKKADEFIDHLRKVQGQRKHTTNGVNPHMHLDNRPGFASAKQLGLIEGRWMSVSRAREKRNALENFLRRRFQINGLSWIRQSDVQRILRAIDAMEAQEKTLKQKGEAHG